MAPNHIADWAPPPSFSSSSEGKGNRRPENKNAKSVLDAEGPEALARWIRQHSPNRVFITDTTMRDAHQSLLATRMRTIDLLGAAEEASKVLHDCFSFEMWGGATFDVAHRFLHESPWKRLKELRKAIPNVCFQMLIRGSNAVGYTSYPDNVIVRFVQLAAAAGIDVFRIFDCFNSVEQMKVCIDAVRECNKVAEVCMCFTGDFLKETEKIYTLDYWSELAKTLVDAGAHMIAIKDMAGLFKPGHAKPMMEAIRKVCDLPVHFHTHSTSGVSLASCVAMAQNGCDIIDCATASLSENTSQPNLNAFLATLTGGPRDTGIQWETLEPLDAYWRRIRQLYTPFEAGITSGSARVFEHQIPGGQYSNLFMQSKSLKLNNFEETLDMYRDVNRVLGDIVKVTPSSKVVGDCALYLIGLGAKAEDLLSDRELDFPQSTIDLCMGRLGKPHMGLPPAFVKKVLKGKEPLAERPGATLPDADLEPSEGKSAEEHVSSLLYPKVIKDFEAHMETYGQVSRLPTRTFWYGMMPGQTVQVEGGDEELGVAETFTVTLVRIGPKKRGVRTLTFLINGKDKHIVNVEDLDAKKKVNREKADPANEAHVASPMSGRVTEINADAILICAMKMEVSVKIPGKIGKMLVKEGDEVDEGDLMCVCSE